MYWFWLNMPLAAAFFVAWVGIPMWLVFKRPGWGARPLAAPAPAYAHQASPSAPRTEPVERRSGDDRRRLLTARPSC